MSDNFVRVGFDKIINVESIITFFYMELSKDFSYGGEAHDFWEMVYMDKGEMVCTAGSNSFVLKTGELTFHKPMEFHNLSGNGKHAPNIGIITFECHSREMRFFEGKIFKLDSEQRAMLSLLINEGLSVYRLVDKHNPLLQRLEKIDTAPIGSSQMTKNLFEAFLILLRRNTDIIAKRGRTEIAADEANATYAVSEIIECLKENLYGRITVSDIAARLGKSESTVKNIFATYRGGGIIRYYNEMKIAEAKKLIREEKYNLAEISELLHFETPQYFSKCFKHITNMTPSEYKRAIVK